VLTGESAAIDAYYVAFERSRKGNLRKPARRLGGWWRDLVSKIEERQQPGWSELAMILLSVEYDDQERCERVYHDLQRNVRHHWLDPRVKDLATLVFGSVGRRDAVAMFAYRQLSRDQRGSRLDTAARSALSQDGVRRAALIGIDVSSADYPYSVVTAVARRTQPRGQPHLAER
jgi:hypothetical protein